LENYKRAKEWLKLSFNNVEKVIAFYKIQEYDACVFRIQLSIEQLQKSLLFLLGFQVRKSHESSKILNSLIYENKIQKIEKEIAEKIKKLTQVAKIIEKEETSTRYGIIKNNKLIPPTKLYDKTRTKEFLDVFYNFLILFQEILGVYSQLSYSIQSLNDLIDKIKFLMEEKK